MGDEDRFKELFDSRLDHESRIKGVETNQTHILVGQEEMKGMIVDLNKTVINHNKQTIEDIKEVKGFVTDTISALNGIPRQNKEDLVTVKEDIEDLKETKAGWRGTYKGIVLVICTIAGLLSLIYMILTYNNNKLYNKLQSHKSVTVKEIDTAKPSN